MNRIINSGTPTVYTPKDILDDGLTMTTEINGQWVPKRPLGFQGLCLLTRLKYAWLVFSGRADVLQWPNQENC